MFKKTLQIIGFLIVMPFIVAVFVIMIIPYMVFWGSHFDN